MNFIRVLSMEAASQYTCSSNRNHKHPFHPFAGSEFEALALKEYSGEHRVCFLDKKGEWSAC